MDAASVEQDILCRTFGNCLCGDEIDMEVGDLMQTKGPLTDKLFTYMRYNTKLDVKGLSDIGITDIDPSNLWAMDNIEHIDELDTIARVAAKKKVKIAHFTGFY